MLPAFDAILGQSSAHSFDTGPVIADPREIENSFSNLFLIAVVCGVRSSVRSSLNKVAVRVPARVATQPGLGS